MALQRQKSGGDFAEFCGLLRIYELYSQHFQPKTTTVKFIYSEKATNFFVKSPPSTTYIRQIYSGDFAKI